MAMSGWLRDARAAVGHAVLVVPGVSALVSDDQGRILLVRHSDDGLWNVPGGAVEPDESPANAVRREIREETGLEVEPTRLVGVSGGPSFRVRYPNGDETSYVIASFACRIVDGTLTPDGEEVLEARFFSWSETEALTMPAIAQALLGEARRAGS